MGNSRSLAASAGAGVIFLLSPALLMRKPRSYMACNSAAGTAILMTILDFNSASVTCSKNISAASCPSGDLNRLGLASSRKRCSASLAVLDPSVRPKMRIVSGVGCSICHGRSFFWLGFPGVKNEPTKIKIERMPIPQYSLRSMVIFERGLLNLNSSVDGFVGANSFARPMSCVRMNSHLQERHNTLKYRIVLRQQRNIG